MFLLSETEAVTVPPPIAIEEDPKLVLNPIDAVDNTAQPEMTTAEDDFISRLHIITTDVSNEVCMCL